MAGEEQGEIYTWLGVRTGKHEGLKAPGVWLGQNAHPPPHPTCRGPKRSLIPWASQGGKNISKTSPCSQLKAALWQVTPAHPEMLPLPYPVCSLLLNRSGLIHSRLYDYTGCTCPRNGWEYSRHLAWHCCQTPACCSCGPSHAALSPLQKVMLQPVSQHTTSSRGTHGKQDLTTSCSRVVPAQKGAVS